MFRNEHGRSFLNDAVRGDRGTAGIKPSARINRRNTKVSARHTVQHHYLLANPVVYKKSLPRLTRNRLLIYTVRLNRLVDNLK